MLWQRVTLGRIHSLRRVWNRPRSREFLGCKYTRIAVSDDQMKLGVCIHAIRSHWNYTQH